MLLAHGTGTRFARLALTVAATLALAAPAAAQSDKARGQADKKVEVTPVAPAPAPASDPAPVETKSEKAPAAAPGKAKKAPVPAPSASAPTTRPKRAGGAKRTAGSRRSGRARAPATPVRSRSRGSGVPAIAEQRRSARAAAALAAERRARRGRERSNAAVPLDQPPAPDDRSGFVLAAAAEDVVEVIPGGLLLALAGLIALTVTLCLRSFLIERRRNEALQASYEGTAHALATAVEAKDDTTGNHIGRVRDLGLLLARELAPREARDPQMAYGFLLHDIGKLAVPDAVLCKPGRLDDHEWTLMRRHCDEGVRILSGVPFLDRAIEVVRHHHERWDGAGYPDGLAGEEIPLWARMFAVVDTLDAITSSRPYRPRQSLDVALEEIRRCAGSQFDPRVVDALERLDRERLEALLEPAREASDAVEQRGLVTQPHTAVPA